MKNLGKKLANEFNGKLEREETKSKNIYLDITKVNLSQKEISDKIEKYQGEFASSSFIYYHDSKALIIIIRPKS